MWLRAEQQGRFGGRGRVKAAQGILQRGISMTQSFCQILVQAFSLFEAGERQISQPSQAGLREAIGARIDGPEPVTEFGGLVFAQQPDVGMDHLGTRGAAAYFSE